ncbi:MAG: PilZ domain-containing protein [Acidobacteria bacterium]|nr:PilZ domain-containing protein [Acidobacteriota bacterium]
MDLQVRVRQIAPPRNLTEVARTLDVSRNGILFRTRQPYDMRQTLWITMPYSPNGIASDPEFPGTVVRLDKKDGGDVEVALLFHSGRADQFHHMQNTTAVPIQSDEKRAKSRVRMALPVRVREGATASAEETTTIDVSRTGILFQTDRQYSIGQTVWVAMPYQPGREPEEVEARVVREVERNRMRGIALAFAPKKSTLRMDPRF